MIDVDIVDMIKTYKKEVGIGNVRLAKAIGIAKSTLEDILYGIRDGKKDTRKKIYDYIVANSSKNYESIIMSMYEHRNEKLLGIHKSEHYLLGLIYIVELIDKDNNIIYEILLENEVK